MSKKKVYVIVDSNQQYMEAVEQYKDEYVELVKLSDVGVVTEHKAEIWDMRKISQLLQQKEIELDLTVLVMGGD